MFSCIQNLGINEYSQRSLDGIFVETHKKIPKIELPQT